MPELPEVETIKNDLAHRIIGKKITEVIFPHDPRIRILRRCCISLKTFAQEIQGSEIRTVRRRAKYLIFDLDPPRTLAMHLGMSGQVLLRPSTAQLERYVRAIFCLNDGKEIRFADPRKFGEILLYSPSQPRMPVNLEALGPEPLDRAFTVNYLAHILKNSRRAIKTVLMDQQAIAGLGNIYSDEILFAACIHPARPASTLTSDEVKNLHRSIRAILRKAVKYRGTTAKDQRYRDSFGRTGSFQDLLQVYQHRGKPCVRCGTSIESRRIGGRTASFCPICQK